MGCRLSYGTKEYRGKGIGYRVLGTEYRVKVIGHIFFKNSFRERVEGIGLVDRWS